MTPTNHSEPPLQLKALSLLSLEKFINKILVHIFITVCYVNLNLSFRKSAFWKRFVSVLYLNGRSSVPHNGEPAINNIVQASMHTHIHTVLFYLFNMYMVVSQLVFVGRVSSKESKSFTQLTRSWLYQLLIPIGDRIVINLEF